MKWDLIEKGNRVEIGNRNNLLFKSKPPLLTNGLVFSFKNSFSAIEFIVRCKSPLRPFERKSPKLLDRISLLNKREDKNFYMVKETCLQTWLRVGWVIYLSYECITFPWSKTLIMFQLTASDLYLSNANSTSCYQIVQSLVGRVEMFKIKTQFQSYFRSRTFLMDDAHDYRINTW